VTRFASLGFLAGVRSALRSGRIPDLVPTSVRRPRQQRTVLEALAEVGPAGMTPNSLEVTTELPEPRLNEALQDLIAAGLVCRQGRRTADDGQDAGGISEPRDDFYLLAEHAGRQA
jgi:hypothetical protein